MFNVKLYESRKSVGTNDACPACGSSDVHVYSCPYYHGLPQELFVVSLWVGKKRLTIALPFVPQINMTLEINSGFNAHSQRLEDFTTQAVKVKRVQYVQSADVFDINL